VITDRAATLTSHQVKTEAKKAGDDTRGLKDSQKLSCGNGKRVVRQKVDDSLDLVLDSCYPNLRLLISSLGLNNDLTETRALSQNVTNAPEGALTPKLKNVKVTV